jgi:RHS repeat-associated protein
VPAFQATVYDAAGRVLQTSNALGHTTSYAYDPLGRVVSQTDALGGVTSFRYDALGNRLSLTDPVDNTTTWTYDALNRVVQETNELGYSRYFVYNDVGYLTRRIDRRGLVREFQYDTLGRNTAEIWYDTAADAEMDANRQNTLNFTYDALGRMLSAGDQFAGYDYTYDRLGRMTISDAAIAGLAPTVTLTNAYGAAGRRTQVAAAISGNADFVTDYMYDQLGRTTSIWQSASPTSVLPVADKRVDLTYDLANQPVTLTRYADLSGNQLVAATDYLFDQAGRLTGMTHSKGASIFADYDWTFDEANRMTRFESLIDGIVDYTNDDTDQLTGADYDYQDDEQYIYDENGNRVNNGYTVGPNNQLLSDGTYTYTYDQEGNRTSKTNIATGELVEYIWDHRNRLTKVTFKDASDIPTKIVEYAYDFGQRWVRKTLDTNADGTIEESRIFVHDADPSRSLGERARVRAPQIVLDFEKTGSSDVTVTDLSHRYLWGANVDQILADETVNNGTADDVAWALTDHLNTVRDLGEYDPATDITSVVKHITYDAFGQITSDSATEMESLLLYTARPYDFDADLQNNLNRWYDLSTGRWMNIDPIGFESGDANLYRYVANHPGFTVDPLGLKVLIFGWEGFGASIGTGVKAMNDVYKPIAIEELGGDVEFDISGQEVLGGILAADRSARRIIKAAKNAHYSCVDIHYDRIVLIGYSWGANYATRVASRMQQIDRTVKIDLVFTIDPVFQEFGMKLGKSETLEGLKWGTGDPITPNNFRLWENYYQTSSVRPKLVGDQLKFATRNVHIDAATLEAGPYPSLDRRLSFPNRDADLEGHNYIPYLQKVQARWRELMKDLKGSTTRSDFGS